MIGIRLFCLVVTVVHVGGVFCHVKCPYASLFLSVFKIQPYPCCIKRFKLCTQWRLFFLVSINNKTGCKSFETAHVYILNMFAARFISW